MSKSKKVKKTNKAIMIECLRMAIACQSLATTTTQLLSLADDMYLAVQAKKK